MLEQLLNTIGFPEALNFDLDDEIIKSTVSFSNYISHDETTYVLRYSDNLLYIKDWGYRSANNGQWVCLDINIKKNKLDVVICKLNELLESYNQDIIDIERFNTHNDNSNHTMCKCQDDLRIDFLNVDSALSIQIVKLKPIEVS